MIYADAVPVCPEKIRTVTIKNTQNVVIYVAVLIRREIIFVACEMIARSAGRVASVFRIPRGFLRALIDLFTDGIPGSNG